MTDPNRQLKRFALLGGLFGLGFPVLGTLLQAATGPHGLSVDGIVAAQSMPLMWIINTAPFILAWFASMVGRREDRLQQVLRELRHSNRALNTKNEELEGANQELIRAGQLKSQFLANMSHELRTPLNAIIGFSRILMKKTEGLLPARQARNIAMVNESGQHLLALVNDVLDIERIQAGMLTVRTANTNVSALAGDVVAKLAPAAEAKELTLELSAGDDLHIDTDPVRLRQVLDNLVNNAIKYSDEGTITLAVSATGEDVKFAIQDEGIGITEEMLKTVFAPFSQVDGSTTRAQGGVGLGLHLVSELVALLGGRVDAESTIGEGSTFTVELPRTGPKSSKPPQPNADAIDLAAHGKGPSVLLIDDTPAMLEVTRSELVDEGFEVHVALSGESGIALARKVRPSAILLDILMPDMDGWAVLKALRADPVLKRIPVIITSQLDQEESAAELGVAGWLTKPTSVGAFRAILDKAGIGARGDVLVVEDDEATAAMVRQHLEELHLVTRHAVDGEAAVEEMRKALPKAVVLDLMLPKLSGFAVLEGLRALPGGDRVPVIIYTAKDLSDEERARLSVGPVAIIGKGNAGGIDSLSEYMRLVELT